MWAPQAGSMEFTSDRLCGGLTQNWIVFSKYSPSPSGLRLKCVEGRCRHGLGEGEGRWRLRLGDRRACAGGDGNPLCLLPSSWVFLSCCQRATRRTHLLNTSMGNWVITIQCTEADLKINLGVHQQRENVYTHSGEEWTWVIYRKMGGTGAHISHNKKDAERQILCFLSRVEPRLYTHVRMCTTWK